MVETIVTVFVVGWIIYAALCLLVYVLLKIASINWFSSTGCPKDSGSRQRPERRIAAPGSAPGRAGL